MLDKLETGSTILSADGEVHRISKEIAEQFRPGDRLITSSRDGLLLIPEVVSDTVKNVIDKSVKAFDELATASDEQIVSFFCKFANALETNQIWDKIKETNHIDVEQARSNGRSTTRLLVSEDMRSNMVTGLRGWAETPTQRHAILEEVSHEDFQIQLIGAALGIVGFVFEGRPNVLADACGVLRGGNATIFRIGSDALRTARTIMETAVIPSLRDSALPADAVALIDDPSHAAGWSLFLDNRLALAVARGSGPAVDQLGDLAQSVGTPVSRHGTGGAWIISSDTTLPQNFTNIVVRSLDRKVCNTLNTCCIPASKAELLIPALISGLETAAKNRGQSNYKIHIEESGQKYLPNDLFNETVSIVRPNGVVNEKCAELIELSDIGNEWEWEDNPEITLIIVESVNHAIELFNTYSPRLVASLVTKDDAEAEHFYETIQSPFVGDNHTRWGDGQFALSKPELGLSNWANGRLFSRGGILTGDSVYTVRTRYITRS